MHRKARFWADGANDPASHARPPFFRSKGPLMSGIRKLSDAEVAQLRERWEEGWTAEDLAAEFDVSARHVRRIASGEQREAIGGAYEPGVFTAVDGFLEGVRLEQDGRVLAAMARALAAKLDACAASESAATAQAAPRLAAQLVDVLTRLLASGPREPDRIDRIKAGFDARRAAASERNGGNQW
jgi:AraC-like DNA-binding protein